MHHSISTLGAFHTAVSVISIISGMYSFIRYQGIDKATGAGRIYLFSLLIVIATSFGLSSTGGFNAGHVLAILAFVAIVAALLVPRLVVLGWARPYLSQLSFSFFLLMVPGINETLTRLPVNHPLAEGPESVIVQTT